MIECELTVAGNVVLTLWYELPPIKVQQVFTNALQLDAFLGRLLWLRETAWPAVPNGRQADQAVRDATPPARHRRVRRQP